MKIVINKANEIRTIFGGVALVAKADLVMESTTIRRVKDVIIITMDGARDRIVTKAKTLKILAEAVPVEASPRLRLTLCAKDGVLQRIVPINKAAKINNFLVMRQYFRRGFFLFEQKGVVCAKQNKKFFAVIFQNNS